VFEEFDIGLLGLECRDVYARTFLIRILFPYQEPVRSTLAAGQESKHRYVFKPVIADVGQIHVHDRPVCYLLAPALSHMANIPS